MKYFTAEAKPRSHIPQCHWRECQAKSVEGAQNLAAARRVFQATTIYVGAMGTDGRIYPIRYRHYSAFWAHTL
jgi:hypothetical protein